MSTQTIAGETTKKIPVWLISFTILLPTAFAMLATSETNVAIPHIAGYFGATLDEANWVITSYMIANAILLPLTAWFENLMGRVNFLKTFIAIFTLGSLLCAFAPSLNFMVLGRLIQGVGGGPLMPISQAILIASFPFEQRGRAMALFALAVMVSSIMGPTVGGFIVDNSSWQWIYLMNIPIGIISCILIQFFIPEKEERVKPKKVDVVGFSLLVVWLLTMQIVLDKGEQYNWFDTTWVCWLAGISLFSFIFFVVWELEYKDPMVNVRILKDKNFAIGTYLGAFVNMIIYVTIVLLPKYLQSIMGYTAYLSGLSLAPRVISCLVMLCFIDKLVAKFDNRILIAIGFGLIGLSTYYYTNLTLMTSFGYIVFPNVILGVGVILTFIPISGLVLGTLPKSELSNGAGLHSLAKCVATVLSVSLSSTMVARLSQVHQTYLVSNLSNTNPVFFHRLSVMTHKFMIGLPEITAMHKASAVYYKQLIVQSKIFAYADVFAIFALIAFCMMPLGFLLKVNFKKNK
ncbi:MAG: DHA2 family efflux MFS transporter permease subunit [Candidatus Gastranaerophilaceae bacterium]